MGLLNFLFGTTHQSSTAYDMFAEGVHEGLHLFGAHAHEAPRYIECGPASFFDTFGSGLSSQNVLASYSPDTNVISFNPLVAEEMCVAGGVDTSQVHKLYRRLGWRWLSADQLMFWAGMEEAAHAVDVARHGVPRGDDDHQREVCEARIDAWMLRAATHPRMLH